MHVSFSATMSVTLVDVKPASSDVIPLLHKAPANGMTSSCETTRVESLKSFRTSRNLQCARRVPVKSIARRVLYILPVYNSEPLAFGFILAIILSYCPQSCRSPHIKKTNGSLRLTRVLSPAKHVQTKWEPGKCLSGRRHASI